jgi:hypothetical protein
VKSQALRVVRFDRDERRKETRERVNVYWIEAKPSEKMIVVAGCCEEIAFPR